MQMELLWKRLRARLVGSGDACLVGEAVMTSAGKERLAATYKHVIHTPPPLYGHHDKDSPPEDALRACYANSLCLTENHDRIATPILGAGCRGFPLQDALDVAAESSIAWCRDGSSNKPQRMRLGRWKLNGPTN